jgi:hypothetical protein
LNYAHRTFLSFETICVSFITYSSVKNFAFRRSMSIVWPSTKLFEYSQKNHGREFSRVDFYFSEANFIYIDYLVIIERTLQYKIYIVSGQLISSHECSGFVFFSFDNDWRPVKYQISLDGRVSDKVYVKGSTKYIKMLIESNLMY